MIINTVGGGSGGGDVSESLQTLDLGKQNNESWVSRTLSASGWTLDNDTNTYYYSLESVYPSANYDILDVLPNSDTTDAMRSAWIAANCGGYEATNIIRCHGTTPTIDIVIGVCVKSKGGILS